MNEKAPTAEQVAEKVGHEQLKSVAPEAADEIVNGISGFADMETVDQIAALEFELETLRDEADNNLRYVYGELSRRKAVLEAVDRYQREMDRLGEG